MLTSRKLEGRKIRHERVRRVIRGTADRPRLAVFRSLSHIYAQLIDDDERREREPPAALHDLGDPVDRNHPIREIQRTRVDTRLSHSVPPLSNA